MRISKLLLLVGTATVCLLLQSVRAADTDDQAKAREALRKKVDGSQTQSGGSQTSTPAPAAVPASTDEEKMRAAMRQKMNELDAQQPAAAAPAATVTPPKAAKPAPKKTSPPPAQATAPSKSQPAPAQAPKPVPAPKTVAAPESPKATPAPVVVAPPPEDSAATAREREALRKKMQELETQPASTSTPAQASKPAQPSAPTAPPPVQPVVTAPAPTAAPAPAPADKAPTPPQQPAVIAQPEAAQPAAPSPSARDQAEQAAQEQATTAPKAGKKAKKTAMQPAYQQPGIEGPALPISTDKKRRLDDLLARYQADEITPAQYHQERAKILAGP